MKRAVSLLLLIAMCLSMAACGVETPTGGPNVPGDSSSAGPSGGSAKPGLNPDSAFANAVDASSGSYDIVMLIPSVATIDDKGSMETQIQGIRKYCEEKGWKYTYMQSTEDTAEAFDVLAGIAMSAGVKYIACATAQVAQGAYALQDKYPDIGMYLINTRPTAPDGKTMSESANMASMIFAEEQAGFLGGYAAVYDGYTKLGFLGGMAVAAVVRFGYGFVQGAEAAAKELGLTKGSIEIKFGYTNNFEANADNQALAASWYQSGTEVIFACGGAMGNSVMAAAEQNNGKVIGVDVDQSVESETVITSIMKDTGAAAYLAISSWFAGDKKMYGGNTVLGCAQNGVKLPMETSKFTKFNKEIYEALYAKLAADENGIATAILRDTDVDSASKIPCDYVKLMMMS